MKSCKNCRHLRVKLADLLKVRPNGKWHQARFNYRDTRIFCRMGHLIKTDGSPKILKDITKSYKTYQEAKYCPDYSYMT